MQFNQTTANRQIAQTSSGPVAYTLLGNGPVTLVLPGASPDGSAGLDPAFLVAAGFSVLTLSHPGSSAQVTVGQPASQAAEAVAALLEVLQIQTCAVIAIGGGCSTGMALAAYHPERVGRLVLMAVETGCTGHFFPNGSNQTAINQQLIDFLNEEWKES